MSSGWTRFVLKVDPISGLLTAVHEPIPEDEIYMPEPAPSTPKKPAPALPVEVYSREPFNSTRAHDAMVALCRGGGLHMGSGN